VRVFFSAAPVRSSGRGSIPAQCRSPLRMPAGSVSASSLSNYRLVLNPLTRGSRVMCGPGVESSGTINHLLAEPQLAIHFKLTIDSYASARALLSIL
jgi:hypothetical protein